MSPLRVRPGAVALWSIPARCRMCPDCKKRWGWEVRQRLLQKVDLFKVPRLYTITVNREWHESPEAAYEYVMGQKFIARLLTKEFGIRSWVWVLEPQEESGGGWPHWHILMDVSTLPPRWYNADLKESSEERPANARGWVWIPHFFDLNRVHRLLRKWRIGEQCKLTVKRDAFDSAKHAVFYITKYLIDTPRRGYPPWMLNRRGLRFAQASRALGALVATKPRKHKEETEESEPRPRSKRRAPVDRIAECSKRMTFIAYVPKLDKTIGAKPFLAVKSSLETFSGAVAVQDFDFASQQSFTVWGFTDSATLFEFARLWQIDGKAHRELTAEIDQRRSELLGAWAAGEPQQQAA